MMNYVADVSVEGYMLLNHMGKTNPSSWTLNFENSFSFRWSESMCESEERRNYYVFGFG